MIQPGDLHWVQVGSAAEVAIPHPHVIIRVNNGAVTVCALTSNRKRIALPGNLLLEAGEGNLPRPSVVEVAKVSIICHDQLGQYIGSLSPRRLRQILDGMQFLAWFTR